MYTGVDARLVVRASWDRIEPRMCEEPHYSLVSHDQREVVFAPLRVRAGLEGGVHVLHGSDSAAGRKIAHFAAKGQDRGDTSLAKVPGSVDDFVVDTSGCVYVLDSQITCGQVTKVTRAGELLWTQIVRDQGVSSGARRIGRERLWFVPGEQALWVASQFEPNKLVRVDPHTGASTRRRLPAHVEVWLGMTAMGAVQRVVYLQEQAVHAVASEGPSGEFVTPHEPGFRATLGGCLGVDDSLHMHCLSREEAPVLSTLGPRGEVLASVPVCDVATGSDGCVAVHGWHEGTSVLWIQAADGERATVALDFAGCIREIDTRRLVRIEPERFYLHVGEGPG
ncbi:MAG: hypothetical protein ACPG77_17465, partial [Nannocystaceae bacterium]